MGRTSDAIRQAAQSFAEQINELGQQNLSAIGRIVAAKYERGMAFNRQHPFVDVLTSDIIESGGKS